MEFDKEAEGIIADRTVREANNHPMLEYFVKWKRLPDSESSWKPIRALSQFQDLIEKFHWEKAQR